MLFEDKEFYLDSQYKINYSEDFSELSGDNIANELPVIYSYAKVYKNNKRTDGIEIYFVQGTDNFYISGYINGYELYVKSIRPHWYKIMKIPSNMIKSIRTRKSRKKTSTK